MQTLQLQTNQFQYQNSKEILTETQDFVPKTKKIMKKKTQQISKHHLKTYLVSKFKKGKNIKKTFITKLSSFDDNLKKLSISKSDFCCPICIQLLIQPVVTQCGHSFCYKCLQSLIEYNPKCPVCRLQLELSQIKVDKNLNKIIQKFSPEDETQYYFQCQRALENYNWLLNKRTDFQKLQVGQYIDIKCPQTKRWTQGCVLQKRIKKQSKQEQICISYTSNAEPIKQWLSLNSSRLASHQFYTGKQNFKRIVQFKKLFIDQQLMKKNQIDINLDKQQLFQYMENMAADLYLESKNLKRGYQKNIWQIETQAILNESQDFWSQISQL